MNITKKLIVSVLMAIIVVATGLPTSGKNADPVADPKAVVTCGNARFTVLTPQMVRIEWSPDARWEDAKSLTFVNRKLEVPDFKKKVSKKGVTISTGALTLDYRNDGKPFDAGNLKITFPLNGKKISWKP